MGAIGMGGEKQSILTLFSRNIDRSKESKDNHLDEPLRVVIDVGETEESEIDSQEMSIEGVSIVEGVNGKKEAEDGKIKRKEVIALKREQVRQEKELRKRQREEEKRKREALREEERIKREERKKQKEIQRLEIKIQKEVERAQKELEKQRKEEAKERAQSRIGNFFKKISDSSKQLEEKSDYQKYFLPFYAKDGVILAVDRFPTGSLEERKQEIDRQLSVRNSADDAVLDWLASKSVKRGGKVKFTAVSLLQQMTSKDKTDKELQSLLKMIPQKYIKFYENVRPPYIGTYSKDVILPVDDPFCTDGTGYDYGYDSDLEWINEEEEDGEQGGVDNLESGEEDEDEEDEEASEGEFEGFLDAEESSNKSRPAGKRKFIGPLIPTVHLRTNMENLDEDDKKYFELVKVEFLIDHQPFPIDPYFQPSSSIKRLADTDQDQGSSSNSPSVSPEKKRPKTLITETAHLLKLFDEIHDSTFSLGTVTEIAQKNLPQYSKQTIKNTVKEYAVKGTGKGDFGKKWVIRDMKLWEDLRSL
ncbi:hypothetical protein HG537_0H03630 [Torulaspora globosa]|uniref:Chromatin assembly factor 1 subunit p90 n=1 Tax=Torulaspora globosa TaxID=48254 RepID=A0A7H9HYU6_9SACH|nr:hypothetical protein HG537_0H03630 [Torulaspora sp. CBS 2947]